jgi:hypothetical protein
MNTVSNRSRIADFVASLDASGLAEAETQIAYQQKTTVASLSNKKTDFNDAERELWEALSVAIKDECLGSVGPPDVYLKPFGRRRFADCAAALDTYVTHACATQLDRAHKRAITVEVLRCLVRWMQSRNIADTWITPRTVCEHLGELPQAVNKAYPFYVKARLLHVIVPRAADAGLFPRV